MNQTTATSASSTETSSNISDVSKQFSETLEQNRGDERRSESDETQLPENFNFCGTVTTEEFPEEFNLEKMIANIRYLQNLSEDSNLLEELGSQFSPIFFQHPDLPVDFNTFEEFYDFPQPPEFSNFSESIDFQNILEYFSQLEGFELPEDLIQQLENIDFSQFPDDLEDFPTIIDEEETSDDIEDSTVDDETSDDIEDSILDEVEELPDDIEDFPTIIDDDSTVDDDELPDDLEDFPTIIDDGELPDGEVFNNPVECFPVDMMEEFFSQSQEDNSSEIPDFPINFEPGDINDIEGEVTILPFPLPGFSEEFDSLTGSFNGEFPTFSETDSEGEVTILPFPLPEGWGEKFDQLIESSDGEFTSHSETDGEIIELPFEYSFTSWVEGGEMPEIMHCFFENDQVMFSAKIPLTQEDLTPMI